MTPTREALSYDTALAELHQHLAALEDPGIGVDELVPRASPARASCTTCAGGV